MAKIIKIPNSRFPKRAKGSPKAGPRPTGAKPDRGLGTGNNRFTKPNNWLSGERVKSR